MLPYLFENSPLSPRVASDSVGALQAQQHRGVAEERVRRAAVVRRCAGLRLAGKGARKVCWNMGYIYINGDNF